MYATVVSTAHERTLAIKNKNQLRQNYSRATIFLKVKTKLRYKQLFILKINCNDFDAIKTDIVNINDTKRVTAPSSG